MWLVHNGLLKCNYCSHGCTCIFFKIQTDKTKKNLVKMPDGSSSTGNALSVHALARKLATPKHTFGIKFTDF